MDSLTRQRLNAINREFYRITAAEFDQTRGQAWHGWELLLPTLNADALRTVLDVGCGNGRFGLFLAERFGAAWQAQTHYHGVDNSAALLAFAADSLKTDAPHLAVTLDQRDIIEQPLDSGLYDLVGIFGVMHHIPGYTERQQFIQSMAARVAPQGHLVFACWRFYEIDRLRERIVAWETAGDEIADLAPLVEPHDYLLDWRRGERALRYCHYVDDVEQAALTQALQQAGLREITRYRADGSTNTANLYAVFIKD